MSNTQALAIMYLVISVGAFTWQLGSTLYLFQPGRADARRRRGLLRTLICRAFAAAMYVTVAVVTLVTDSFPIVGLAVFALTQLIWVVNSIFDVR